MNKPDMQKYLEARVRTATPEQLVIMMYDGAIRFGREAVERMKSNEIEKTHEALIRTQRIICELWCSLNPEHDKVFCDRLSSLYNWMYLELVHANVEKDPGKVERVITLLDEIRGSWVEAVDKMQDNKVPLPAQHLPPTGTDGQPGLNINA